MKKPLKPPIKIQFFQTERLVFRPQKILNCFSCHLKNRCSRVGFYFHSAKKQMQTPPPPSYPCPWGWGQKAKIPLIHDMDMLHIKLKEIINAATW